MTITVRALGAALALLAASAPSTALAQSDTPAICPARAERHAESTDIRVVRITLYNHSRMKPADIDRLLAVANTIWTRYGITFEPGGGPGAVAVVLTDEASRRLDDPSPMVLGSTLFTSGHATPYIKLSLTAAEALAGDSSEGGISFTARPARQQIETLTRILGVAFAHEMAHYLLDTSRHSSVGLLQPGLSVHEVSFPDLTYLKLTRDQQRLLQTGTVSSNCR